VAYLGSEAFVAAGYFCFSGLTGFGDLATGTAGEGLGAVPMPILWRVGEFALGAAVYVLIIMQAIKTLATMIGKLSLLAVGRVKADISLRRKKCGVHPKSRKRHLRLEGHVAC
jgi:hypothetical protein